MFVLSDEPVLLKSDFPLHLFAGQLFFLAHLFSQRLWAPNSGLWSVSSGESRQELQTATRDEVGILHWGGCFISRALTGHVWFEQHTGNYVGWLLKSLPFQHHDSVRLNGGCQVNTVFSLSFNKCFLSTYYVLGFTKDSGDMVANKTDVTLVLMHLESSGANEH